MTESPWDPGVQNERTRLAWQRTTLSVLVGNLIIARLVAGGSLAMGLGIGALAAVATAVLGFFSVRRYRLANAQLHANHPIGDGWQNLLVVILVLISGVGGLAYVLFVA